MKKENIKPILPIDLPQEIALKAFSKGMANSNMGKQKIYGIFDKQMGFANVFLAQNDGIVCRDIAGAIKSAKANNTPSPMKDFPDQFSIWEVAEIDHESKAVKQSLRLVMEVNNLIEMTN